MLLWGIDFDCAIQACWPTHYRGRRRNINRTIALMPQPPHRIWAIRCLQPHWSWEQWIVRRERDQRLPRRKRLPSSTWGRDKLSGQVLRLLSPRTCLQSSGLPRVSVLPDCLTHFFVQLHVNFTSMLRRVPPCGCDPEAFKAHITFPKLGPCRWEGTCCAVGQRNRLRAASWATQARPW